MKGKVLLIEWQMVSLMDFLAAACKEIHHPFIYVYEHRITIKR